MTERHDHFMLAPDKRAVREARQHVRAFTGLPREVAANAELVVSELVANSVLHAHMAPEQRIEVTLRLTRDRFDVEVADPGGFARRPRGKNGLGFRVLDAVCPGWQVDNGRVCASIAVRRGASPRGAGRPLESAF